MKTTKTIALATALLFAWQGVWAEQKDPIGSIDWDEDGGYYKIVSADDLIALANYVNDGNDCEGLTFKVTDNITFNKSDEFIPIGIGDESEGYPFAGTFDGQGKTISGIEYSDNEGIGIGLFGYIHSPAVIKDLKIDNCSFTANFEVGAIVGASAGSNDNDNETDNNDWGIFNCIVGENVYVTANEIEFDGAKVPGALVGGIIGSCENMKLSNCTSAAIVKGDDCVGGITGRLLSSLDGISEDSNERAVLENCYFTGTVSGETNIGDIAGARGPVDTYDGDGTNGLYIITLLDDDTKADIKNETRLANYDSQVCNVTLSGRTFYKDKSWNTLCLPFNLTKDQIEDDDCPLKGATIMSLDYATSEFENGTLTMNFTKATEISNKMPYIVKWDQSTDKENPVFNGVKVEFNETAISHEDADVVFMDVYNTPKVIEGEDNTILYLGAGNTLYYPSAAMTINAFRGYFQLQNDLTAGDPTTETGQQPIKAFVLNFGDEETGIITVNGSGLMVNGSEAWFTLDGRRLNGQPTHSGIFIHGGKKVILP